MTPANPYREHGELVNFAQHIPPQGGSVECECKDANACLAWGCAREHVIAQYEAETAPPKEIPTGVLIAGFIAVLLVLLSLPHLFHRWPEAVAFIATWAGA